MGLDAPQYANLLGTGHHGRNMKLKSLKSPRRMLSSLANYARIFGLLGIYYAAYVGLTRSKKVVRVARRWSRHPLYIRLNSTDIHVFRQIFCDREYEIIQRCPGKLEVIVDAGANIGLASVFMAAMHPDARIYAIEPEQNNFNLLEMNTAPYERIQCIKGALWDRDEPVNILFPNAGDWFFRVGASAAVNTTAIQGYRVSSLIQRLKETRISLLKIDIEGAEWEVLHDAQAWIAKVDNIVIELHEHLKPGVTDLFKKTTADFAETATGRELTLACRP